MQQPDYTFARDPNFDVGDDIRNNLAQNIKKAIERQKIKPLIVTDMDQVLVRIDIKWGLEFAMKYPEYFEEKGLSREQIYERFLDPVVMGERTQYCVNDFFGIDKKSEYYQKFYDIYSTGDFYEDLNLTSFGEIIKALSDERKAEVYIISHCINDVDAASKQRFINEHLPNCGFYLIKNNIKKSVVINEKGLNDYSIFVDDVLANIEDVFLKTNSVAKEFIFPEFGYNKNYDYLIDPIMKNMSKLTRFDLNI